MPNTTRLIRSTLAALLVCAASATIVAALLPDPVAARHVPAEVSVNGTVVLKASTGDNGHPDADEVWDYLKTLTFKPTEEFAELKVAPDADQFLLSAETTGEKESRIEIQINYGGRCSSRELRFTRVPRDRFDREWKLDPEQIDKMFTRRYISRRAASQLTNPQLDQR